MSARKKTSKSSSKKQDESANKTKNATLLNFLQQKVQQPQHVSDQGNLASLILESLLEKDSQKLDSLLSQWSNEPQAVRHVIDNMIESKVSLFASKIAQLLVNNQSKLYLYVWLLRILQSHPTKVPERICEQLESVESGEGSTEELMKLQGKLNLILQE